MKSVYNLMSHNAIVYLPHREWKIEEKNFKLCYLEFGLLVYLKSTHDKVNRNGDRVYFFSSPF